MRCRVSVEREGGTLVVAIREAPAKTNQAGHVPPSRYVTIAIALSDVTGAFATLMRAFYGRRSAVAELELDLSGDLTP